MTQSGSHHDNVTTTDVSGKPPVDPVMPKRKLRSRMALILLYILVLSLGISNFLLYRFASETYSRLLSLQLDPIGCGDNAKIAMEPAAVGGTRVVLFGDSRIAQWKRPPQRAGLQLVNRGRAGDTTAMLLLRLQRDVISLQPQIVVVQAGINDLKAIGVFPERADEIAQNCIRNIDSMVHELRSRGMSVVIMTVLPRGRLELARRLVWSEVTDQKVQAVNDHIRKLATEGIVVIDCDSECVSNGMLKNEYSLDTLHLNDAGYAVLSGLLEPALVKTLHSRTPRS